MDMESPLLIGDPYINVLPYTERADASETTSTSFSIELSAKFTRAPLDEDSDDDEALIFDDTRLESVIISRDLPLSLDVLKNDNDENDRQFRAALDAFLAEVHVPSSLSSMLTDGIVE
ncbi:hypothetical protein PanWU01x14_174290 [Parasponia andersonii]|uniref:Uncharacterized protein n=1 Tax=Parasponia andersonii TaxID=3476 RepID=A0A2P5C8C6_PARAD|nr:hypothetical protein PanWU01x14_174290 [Parasponia andersonii]